MRSTSSLVVRPASVLHEMWAASHALQSLSQPQCITAELVITKTLVSCHCTHHTHLSACARQVAPGKLALKPHLMPLALQGHRNRRREHGLTLVPQLLLFMPHAAGAYCTPYKRKIPDKQPAQPSPAENWPPGSTQS